MKEFGGQIEFSNEGEMIDKCQKEHKKGADLYKAIAKQFQLVKVR